MLSLWNLILVLIALAVEQTLFSNPFRIYQSISDSHLLPSSSIDQVLVKALNQYKRKLTAATQEMIPGCQKLAILSQISFKDLHILSQPTMQPNLS